VLNSKFFFIYYLFIFFADVIEPEVHDAPTLCPSTSLARDGCWTLSPGHAKHVSVGPAGVWVINYYDQIFYKAGTYGSPMAGGSGWTRVDGALFMSDVGTNNMWGINSQNYLYDRNSISAASPAGSNWNQRDTTRTISWTSISPRGSLWVVDTSGNLKHRRDSSNALRFGSDSWDVLLVSMAARVDAGLAGVWVLDTAGQLLCRAGTYGDSGTTGTQWLTVDGPLGAGTLTSVSSGKHVVAVADDAGRVWLRAEVGPDTPQGVAWLRLAGHLKQLEVYETDDVIALWGVDFTSPYQQIYYKFINK
jgi:hypothetical protein